MTTELMLTFSILALLMVTGMCAWLTYLVIKNAREESSAAMKMTEGLMEQTQSLKDVISAALRPLLAVNVIQMTRGENGNSLPLEIEMELKNNGRGLARNIIVSCDGVSGRVEYTEEHFPFLESGNCERFSLNRITTDTETIGKPKFMLISVTYDSELGEHWRTILRLANENDSWRYEGSTSTRV
jgi:hypothetical protein